jgi:hypothetical protein
MTKKQFKEAERKFKGYLQRSPIDVEYVSQIKDPDDGTMLEIQVKVLSNELSKNLEQHIINRAGCLSGFFNYVYNSGHDFGPSSKNKSEQYSTTFYMPNDNFTSQSIDELCIEYNSEAVSYLSSKLDEITTIDEKAGRYVKRAFCL